MLNRKDITIVVAKENGRDQQIQTVARRVMLLAEKNTARFAKANAKREERKAALLATQQEITALEESLEAKYTQIKELTERLQYKKANPAPMPSENINKANRVAYSEGISFSVDFVRQVLESDLEGQSESMKESDRQEFEESLQQYQRGEISASYIKAYRLNSLAKFVYTIKTNQGSGNPQTFLYGNAWVGAVADGHIDRDTKELYRLALIDCLGIKLNPKANGKVWREWLLEFIGVNEQQVKQFQIERDKRRQEEQAQEEAERQRQEEEERREEEAIEAEEKAKKARLAESLGLNPNDIGGKRAVAALTKDSPIRAVLSNGQSVIFRTRKEFVEGLIADGANRIDITYKVREPYGSVFEPNKYKWMQANEEQYNKAKQRGLKVAEIYHLIRDNYGTELTKYEYLYAKHLLAQKQQEGWDGNEKAQSEPETVNNTFGDFEVKAQSDTNGSVVFQQPLSDEEVDKVAALLNKKDITVIMVSRNKTFTVAKSNDGKTLEQAVNEALKGSTANTGVQESTPIEVTGNELGDFDTDTPEGKKALREAAFDYLKELAQKGETVFCRALNADVGFSMTGAKKHKQISGNPIKNLAVARIKELIQNGQQYKEAESYDANEKRVGTHYHYLRHAIAIKGETYGVRLVIRENGNGTFHYDLQLRDAMQAVWDSLGMEKAPSSNVAGSQIRTCYNSASPQADNLLDNNVINNSKPSQALFDSSDEEGGWVLNLFLTDANGNPIPDEDWEEEETPSEKPENEESSITDKAFLQSIINGSADMNADDFVEKLTAIAERYTGQGGEMEELVEQASIAFMNAEDKATKDI